MTNGLAFVDHHIGWEPFNASKQDSRERISIEGKFGQGKNGYKLNYIRAKLQKTSQA